MKDFATTGVWWLPGREHEKLAGSLSFSSLKGACLSLTGAFLESSGQWRFRAVRHGTIHGSTQSGKVTLTDCFLGRHGYNMHGPASQDWHASAVIVGEHLPDSPEPLFVGVAVCYSHLSDWIAKRVFKVNDPGLRQRSGASRTSFSVRFTPPRPLTVQCSIGEVGLSFALSTKLDKEKSVTLSHVPSLSVRGHPPQPMDHWRVRFISPVRDFLTLATGRPNYIDEVWAFLPSETLSAPVQGASERRVQVLFRVAYDELKRDEIRTPNEMIFTLDCVAKDLARVFERWLQFESRYECAVRPYFGMTYSPYMYLEQAFIDLTRSCEAYHKLKSGQSCNFKKRIDLLIDACREAIPNLVSDRSSFATKVEHTRNYLMHSDLSLRDKAARGEELELVVRQLSFLFRACMMSEAGFTNRRIGKLLRHNMMYDWLTRPQRESRGQVRP